MMRRWRERELGRTVRRVLRVAEATSNGGRPRRVPAVEKLEPRCVLSTLSDSAFDWLQARTTENRSQFFVYQDADSGFNHGFPSGIFAGDGIPNNVRQDLIAATSINAACVNDGSSPTGCSSSPLALDRQRGQVLRVGFPPLQGVEFVGLNIEEPEKFGAGGAVPNSVGYDLRGVERLLFDVRSVAPAPWQVRFEVAGRSTAFVSFPANSDFTSVCIDLVHASPQNGCLGLTGLPDLSNVHVLMAIVTDAAHGPQGGSLLFDNIRFDPTPTNPAGDGSPADDRLGFPRANVTYGVVPAVIHAADDGDAGFALTGPWGTVALSGAYQGDQRVATAGSDSQATWSFTGLEPRYYVVEATWHEDPGNATNSPFTLRDGLAAGASFAMNQTLAPGGRTFDGRKWVTIGEVRVTSGTLNVELNAATANGLVVADGVRIVPTIPPDQAIRNMTTIYESSLAVFAFLDRGSQADLAAARGIADAMVYALHNDIPGNTALPATQAGARGLRDSYSSGDLAWHNGQPSSPPQLSPEAGDIRLVGFTSDTRLCGPSSYCLVLDGAFGGNNAFGMLALTMAFERFGDVAYLNAAREIGDWVYEQLADPQGPYFNANPATQTYGGYFLGYADQGVDKTDPANLERGKSIENNGDLFAAYSRLATVQAERGLGTEAAEWTRRANIAGDMVMSLYDAGDPDNPRDGHFATGVLPDLPGGPPTGPGLEPDLGSLRGGEYINAAKLLDSNTFTTLPLAGSARYRNWRDANGRVIDWREPLRFVIDHFSRDIQVAGQQPLNGYSIYATPTGSEFRPGRPIDGLADGIAWEFTGQVAATGRFLNDLYGTTEFAAETDAIVATLANVQANDDFGDGLGIVASTLNDPTGAGHPPLDQCLGTPFQCIAQRPGLAATAWAIYAEQGLNPFTGREVSPLSTGQTFVIDDYDNKVTLLDLGANYFGGNSGAVNLPAPTQLDDVNCPATDQITCLSVAPDSHGPGNHSLQIDFDFARQQPLGAVGGIFSSLFGLTDTKTILHAGDPEPATATKFPGYFLDLTDLFRGSNWRPDRSADWLELDLRLQSPAPVTVKIELTEELPPGAPDTANPDRVYSFRRLDSNDWQTLSLRLPAVDTNGNVTLGDFTAGDVATFDPRRVSVVALIFERSSGVIENPIAGRLLLDNLRLRDADGSYPDLETLANVGNASLTPAQERTLQELVRNSSLQYFVDYASPNQISGLDNGGLIQDRSTFADLLTVGGVGFQLTSYVIAAERGLLDQADALQRVRDIFALLDDTSAQGPAKQGTTGYQGFFYHFLGQDGRRKLNFDFAATADVDESQNTVELSVIDTALAIAGVVTAGRYFAASDPALAAQADAIYGRVNWPFMLYVNQQSPGDPANNQFLLGWKPNETRDDDSGRFGRFQLTDANGLGQYSSRLDQGVERPATLDFYTDEALLVALLAMGSPNPAHRVGREAWDAIVRAKGGGDFFKTYPGALFSYQFLSAWVPTEFLGPDDDPQPMDLFANTQSAIVATREYAKATTERATWTGGAGADLWGLSATEGPFDSYFADAAETATLGTGGRSETVVLDAEGPQSSGDGVEQTRGDAYGQATMLVQAGQSRQFSFHAYHNQVYSLALRYSNDNGNLVPSETVTVSVDGNVVFSFTAADTGDGGAGWNRFAATGDFAFPTLLAGDHVVTVAVSGGDGFGVELDALIVGDVRPPENGTVTVYGAGSSIVHEPELATSALWKAYQLGLFHSRVGVADAYNRDIADARPGLRDMQSDPHILRDTGSWRQVTGFAIDHGPLAILIDNYLSDQFVPRQFTAHAGIQAALREVFHPWNNPRNPLDVDGDTFVVSLDALIVINDLNGPGPRALDIPVYATPQYHVDVQPDGFVAPNDALAVVNFLNGIGGSEGEANDIMAPSVPDVLRSRRADIVFGLRDYVPTISEPAVRNSASTVAVRERDTRSQELGFSFVMPHPDPIPAAQLADDSRSADAQVDVLDNIFADFGDSRGSLRDPTS